MSGDRNEIINAARKTGIDPRIDEAIAKQNRYEELINKKHLTLAEAREVRAWEATRKSDVADKVITLLAKRAGIGEKELKVIKQQAEQEWNKMHTYTLPSR